MSKVVLARIDDRLIHGQVMTSWLNFTGANKIIVVDDETAADSFMKMIVTSCAPSNVKTVVYTKAEAVKYFNSNEYTDSEDKIIILAKDPETYLTLSETGIIAKINLGGMGSRQGRTTLYKNISASPEEKKAFVELLQKGIEISIQIVAEDNKIDIKKIIEVN